MQNKTANIHKPVDFCLGPAEMIESITNNKIIVSAELALHITELTHILQYPKSNFNSSIIKSSID